MNIIYYALQKEQLYPYRFITFKFSNLRKLMGLDKNEDYVQRMKKALEELMQTIELHNYKHIDGKTYQWFATRFLNEARFEKKNDEWIAILEVNQTIKEIMQLKGNFTKLDLLIYQNKMRTKYGMKLYEFLKSFENYRYITLEADYIRKLLKLQDSRTYKNFANLKQLLNRQTNEINKKTDLKNLKLEITEDREFKFIINPKSSKKTPGKKEKEEKLKEFLEKSFIRF